MAGILTHRDVVGPHAPVDNAIQQGRVRGIMAGRLRGQEEAAEAGRGLMPLHQRCMQHALR